MGTSSSTWVGDSIGTGFKGYIGKDSSAAGGAMVIPRTDRSVIDHGASLANLGE